VVAPKAYNDAQVKKGVVTVKIPAKSIIVLNIK
jgi:alpha-N-arabinofuranosidase